MTYIARSGVVKVSIGPATGNRVVRIVRAGDVIPEGVEQDTLDALEKRRLIERVEETPDPEPDAGAGEPGGPPANDAPKPVRRRRGKATDAPSTDPAPPAADGEQKTGDGEQGGDQAPDDGDQDGEHQTPQG